MIKLNVKKFLCTVTVASLVLLTACQHTETAPPTLYQLLDSSGIHFTNTVYNTKDFNIFSYRNFYNGGGVAIGDVNNDGLADVFFTANMSANKLYLNKGAMKFEDFSRKAGFVEKTDWSTGTVMADINSDGWLDIYVCNAGYINGTAPQNQLFINNHNGTFTDSAAQYGLTNTGGYCTHATFFDYDLDGDLDCFIINNSFIPVNTLNYANKRDMMAKDWPVADFLKGGGDRFLRNDNGKYTDISQQAGVHGSLISFGLGVTVGDVNGDNWPDVYVSNDFFERDYLYINQRNGTFKDELEQWMGHTSLASMGADLADVNNDGFPDIFTTDMLPSDDYRLKTTSSFDNIDVYNLKVKSGFYHQFQQNCLQVNNQHGKFSEVASYSGVQASDWSWGALMFDADNDGLTDLYVCNGIYHDITDQDFIDFFANDVVQKLALTGEKEDINSVIEKMPSVPVPDKAFKNNGNLRFTDEGTNWGFTKPSFSNGAAYGDLDNDGDLDIVINNVNEQAFVYQNNSRQLSSNHYIAISVAGIGKNTFAIGAKIKIFQKASILSREVIPSRGFQSSVDYKSVIGLGNNAVIDSMQIIWPGGFVSTFVKPSVDSLYKFKQPEATNAKPSPATPAPMIAPLLTAVNSDFDKHTEDDYIDFYGERLIPKMLSREGPKAAVGDVNGDGLEDIFIGGAAGQGGQLYLQNNTGLFNKKSESVFQQFRTFEDVAVLFFDCDKDGDLDLFAGSGGNHLSPESPEYNHRLYVNDGKGNFAINQTAFPTNQMNTAVAAANDFDNDGDLDLFVGSRSQPMNYGATPQSYLYINDGRGRFADIAKNLNPDIANVGMVTSAVWANITGDAKKELVIVGEWMAPQIFSYNGKKFEKLSTSFDQLYGWWQSVNAADLNNDGKEDLVLGNIGENFYLHPDAQHPVKLYLNDFDKNGSVDKLITRTIDGKEVTVFLKREITEQLPSLKKQNLKYKDYAVKTIQELFTTDGIANSTVKQFNYNSSVVALNTGNGKFDVQRLPDVLQYSSINAIKCMDVNSDGWMDFIAGGNEFGFPPQFCVLDASLGYVALNNGKGGFNILSPAQSGLELNGQIRDMVSIKGKNGNYVLVLINDEKPRMYKVETTKGARKFTTKY